MDRVSRPAKVLHLVFENAHHSYDSLYVSQDHYCIIAITSKRTNPTVRSYFFAFEIDKMQDNKNKLRIFCM
jgi:hypothetical protein